MPSIKTIPQLPTGNISEDAVFWASDPNGGSQDIRIPVAAQRVTNTAIGAYLVFAAGSALVLGTPVYVGSDAQFYPALQTGSENPPAVGISIGSYATGSDAVVLTNGVIHNGSFAFSNGSELYVGSAALTNTLPSGAGIVSQSVGFSVGSTLLINVTREYIVLSE